MRERELSCSDTRTLTLLPLQKSHFEGYHLELRTIHRAHQFTLIVPSWMCLTTSKEYAKKTRTLEATVEELTNDANARTEETIEAKKHQKECIAVRFPTAIGIHVTLCGHIRVLSSEISLVRPYSR